MDGHPLVQGSSLDRIFFQVMIEYQDCAATSDIPEDARTQESVPIGNLFEADEIARHTIKQIHTMFPGTELIELALDQAPDGYHLLVVGDDGTKVVKVGVVAEDYSRETIH